MLLEGQITDSARIHRLLCIGGPPSTSIELTIPIENEFVWLPPSCTKIIIIVIGSVASSSSSGCGARESLCVEQTLLRFSREHIIKHSFPESSAVKEIIN